MGHADKQDIIDLIYSEIKKVSDKDIELKPETDIASDLELDSLSIMDMIFELEEHFNISVPMNDLGDVRTVNELAELIMRLK